MVFIYVNLAFTMYTLNEMPYGRSLRWKATLNEVYLVLMTYHQFMFNKFVTDP